MFLSLLAKFAPKILPVIGGLFKGKLTKGGDIGQVIGTVIAASPHALALFGVITPENFVAALHELGGIIVALSALVSALGFGRKTADARAAIQSAA